MFTRILVCLDGSQLAEQILPYVAQLALQFKSKVTLLHVIGPAAAPVGPVDVASAAYPYPTPQELQKDAALRAKEYLDKIAAPLRGEGFFVDTDVVGGTAGEAITAYADDHAADLIAIASRGNGGLTRMIFGSVADFVTRKATQPILLVAPQES